MIPTAALAHGLEFPRGGVVKRNLNNAQRPCEVEQTEFEETSHLVFEGKIPDVRYEYTEWTQSSRYLHGIPLRLWLILPCTYM